jgi:oligopeptide/dipeptide ABC transporter ATP-binding protein
MSGPVVTVPNPSSPRPLVDLKNVRKTFEHRGSRAPIVAVDGVSLEIERGESVGIVGESGSGKTTLARCLVRLTEPTSGSVTFDGVDITAMTDQRLRQIRKRFQIVFQDPYDSLDPRWTARRTIEEPLILLGGMTAEQRRERVRELLSLVRLGDRFLDRYPHHLSGGQQQRVGIARALATNPDLVVLDEPTSALDALVRIEILELLNALRERLRLTYVYISHDIGSVRLVCDRIAVMYLGKIVEDGSARAVIADPQHPYTRALMSAVLEPHPGGRSTRSRLPGEPPSLLGRTTGCPLHTRCPIALAECALVDQELLESEPGHRVACMRITRGDAIDWPTGWLARSPTEGET